MKLNELEEAWNAQSDRLNQWCELGLDEIVHFAQEQEREACAKVCEQQLGFIAECPEMAQYCAEAIRERRV